MLAPARHRQVACSDPHPAQCDNSHPAFVMSVRRSEPESREVKGKGTQLNDYILTKSVSVEAIGCEQLAQSRYAAAPWPGIELATS